MLLTRSRPIKCVGEKKVFQNSMQNFAFREGPNNAHKLHAARIIADFAYINLKS